MIPFLILENSRQSLKGPLIDTKKKKKKKTAKLSDEELDQTIVQWRHAACQTILPGGHFLDYPMWTIMCIGEAALNKCEGKEVLLNSLSDVFSEACVLRTVRQNAIAC